MGLRIQHCHYHGSGCSCGSDSIPGPKISTCHGRSQKKKKKMIWAPIYKFWPLQNWLHYHWTTTKNLEFPNIGCIFGDGEKCVSYFPRKLLLGGLMSYLSNTRQNCQCTWTTKDLIPQIRLVSPESLGVCQDPRGLLIHKYLRTCLLQNQQKMNRFFLKVMVSRSRF